MQLVSDKHKQKAIHNIQKAKGGQRRKLKVSMKALRVNAELNQAEAARRIGVNISTLSNWEIYASFPTLDQLLALCKVYGCTLDDIRLPDNIANSDDDAN